MSFGIRIQQLQNRFLQYSKNAQAAIVIGLASAVVMCALIISHAATSAISAEGENGSLSGAASLVQDSSASGNKAVVFGRPPTGSNVMSYTASSENLANPEQGFYYFTETHYRSDTSGYVPLSVSDLTAKRSASFQQSGLNVGPTALVHRYFYIEKYRDGSSIDQNYLSLLDADLAAVRAAHDKIILRFAYRADYTGQKPYGDAPSPAAVLSQINQLSPTLNKYADVITAVEAGFIGVWGEWYYTDNYTSGSDMGVLSGSDWTNRTNLLNALLTKLDSRIFVLVRYVGIKQHMFGLNPTDPTANRVGFHNDAFEASSDDYGTYSTFTTQSVSQNQAYLAAQPPLPQSGESANYNAPQSDWSQASSDLAKYHWSSLNPSYFSQTLQAWGQSNVNTVSQKLGYRLELQSASVSGSGPNRTLNVTIKNSGFAAPFRNRPINIVLRNGTDSYTTVVDNQDIRNWKPGSSISFSQAITAPSKNGNYSIYLVLPDPTLSLATIMDYSIRLANTGMWDSNLGNNLNISLTY